MAKKEFLYRKERALKSLEESCNEKKVDKEILPILNLINKLEGCYTSSSCSGRIVLLEIPKIGDKKSAEFLGKWHRNIILKDIDIALTKAKNGYLWIIAQSPIIHLVVDKIDTADKILKIAIRCGFKNSGIKSIAKKIVVEVCSTERIDAPIGRDGFLYYKKIYLQILVDISNEILEKSTKKLLKFEDKLRLILI